MSSNEKSARFWDRQAKSFTKQEQNVELSENKDYKTILKYLDINDTVLDYGCATGIVSNVIADKVNEIHAIDISPKMIEIAKTKASEFGIKNIHYTPATIFDEIYEKESFNMIYAFRILHMLEDLPAVIRRINELLKPGGIFISVSTCMGSLKLLFSPLAFLLRKTRIVPLHINFFTLSELQGIISAEGFQTVEHEKMDDRVSCYCIVARKL